MEKVDMSDDEDDKLIIKGNLMKSVVNWHNEICGVLTIKFVEEHTPDFVKEVIDDENSTVPNDSGEISDKTKYDPFKLHVTLLMKASQMIISCLANVDLSRDTVSAIANWFELFKQPEFDDFLLSDGNHEEWKRQVKEVQDDYEHAIDANTIGSGNLGQFFDPSTLFLYLAHAVFMECYDPSFVCLVKGSKHGSNRKQTAGQNRSEETFEWQVACGILLKFRLGDDSFKGMTGSDPMEFPILNNLNPMRPSIERYTQAGLTPAVHDIYKALLEKMHDSLNEKAQLGGITLHEREREEFHFLDEMVRLVHNSTEEQKPKLVGREKYFRNAVRKGASEFRIDRDFNNDLFLTGGDRFANITKCRKKQNEEKCDELKDLF